MSLVLDQDSVYSGYSVPFSPGSILPSVRQPVLSVQGDLSANKLKKRQIFSLMSRESLVAQCTEEDGKRNCQMVPSNSRYACLEGSVPERFVPGWTSEHNVRDDSFWGNFSYYGDEEAGDLPFRVTASSSEVCLLVERDRWAFPGREPVMKFSSGNTFAIKYRGPIRSEIVEFELTIEGGQLQAKIINDSRTSDLSDIEYLGYELTTLDYTTCVEPTKALMFRGGIHTPYTVFKRIMGEETLWKDLAQEAGIERSCFGQVVSMSLVCNGLAHVVHYILPPNHKPGERHPTVFYVHGGPTGHYDGDFSSIEHSWLQYIASQGYVAVGINYRGNTGYGADYQHAIIGDFGGQHIEDVKQMAVRIRQLDCVDPQKMHYFGHSFGSYTGGMLLSCHGAFVQQTFKTMILASGVYDWSKNIWAKDADSFFGPFDKDTAERRMGGWLPQIHKQLKAAQGSLYADPASDAELNGRISPMAQRVLTPSVPVLLIHGDADTQVTLFSTQQFYERLKHEGAAAECVFVNGAVYGYAGAEASCSFVRNLSSFLGTYS